MLSLMSGVASLSIMMLMVGSANSEGNRREHKVHNIVLYPERHSWCQTTPIKQIVAMPGFEPITIDNNVCVGACYSYSIPRTQPAEPGELIGPYCDSCQPKETKCYHVTLKSAGKSMQKRVQVITNCSCSTCGKQLETTDCDLTDVNTSELPTNLLSLLTNQELKVDLHEVPELLTVGSSPISNSTGTSGEILGGPDGDGSHIPVESRSYKLAENIVKVLNDVQKMSDDDDDDDDVGGEDEDEDDDVEAAKLTRSVQMQQLLDLVQGADGKLTDKDVMEFVNYVNEHIDLELDSLKLKRALEHFQLAMHREELRMRHRNYGLGHLNQHFRGNLHHQGTPTDADAHEHEHEHEQISVITGIEGSHLGVGHKKGSHIGMGIKNQLINDNSLATVDDNDGGNDDDEKMEVIATTTQSALHGLVGHHQVGEEQRILGGVGHLVMGPHGSLVVAPVEEKLNLASDEMAPNHEGIIIDYHHHDDGSHGNHHVHHNHGRSHNHQHGGGSHDNSQHGSSHEEIVSQRKK